ncbi:hypothetical protein [Roseomonas populi]|uniref:Uncharacterized protein n=1 Tax=Roseomonas populi TaxID=3121582 RepID=A0ABT1X2K9_9PROT|nr:hypothetical protein [Roseomonas pecuniae]MCR0982346.1 hypothetical protein [Roseomonas pecuniae]
MPGINDLTILSLLISLCGLVPVGMAFAEDPSALNGEGARPGNRIIGFLAGR